MREEKRPAPMRRGTGQKHETKCLHLHRNTKNKNPQRPSRKERQRQADTALLDLFGLHFEKVPGTTFFRMGGRREP